MASPLKRGNGGFSLAGWGGALGGDWPWVFTNGSCYNGGEKCCFRAQVAEEAAATRSAELWQVRHCALQSAAILVLSFRRALSPRGGGNSAPPAQPPLRRQCAPPEHKPSSWAGGKQPPHPGTLRHERLSQCAQPPPPGA